MGERSECVYSFDADQWERENDAETPVTGVWECPHEQLEERDRCLFHLSPAERREMDITPATVADEFLQKIQVASPEQRWFVGAEFGELSLNYTNVTAESRHPIHLHHTTFKDRLNISFATFEVHLVVSHCKFAFLDAVSAEFEYECYFSESTIEEANFRSSRFTDYVEFDGSTIGQARFSSVEFLGDASFERAVFEGETDFSFATLERGNNFERAEFLGSAYFVRTKIEALAFSNAVFRGEVDFTRSEIDNANFDAVFDEVTFTDTRFTEEFDFAAATFEGELVVDLSGTIVRRGRIVVQRDDVDKPEAVGTNEEVRTSNVYFNFSRATIGRVALDSDSDNVFDHVLVTETDYDGFDFARYGPDLSKIDWNIHASSADREQSGFHSIEITYAKAKEAAHATGNNTAASKFFRREMRYRRRNYLDSLRDADSTDEKLQLSGKAIANYLLDVLSGYGERPWRVVGISVGLIVLSGLLYPFLGGIQMTPSPDSVTYAFDTFSGGSTVAYPEWVLTIGRSMYFSVVTFTTLGYGDLQPATGAVRVVASVEAFSGALLMALLVFVLGRSVRW